MSADELSDRGEHGSRVELRPQTVGDTRAMLAAMSDAERAEVSPEWLARLDSLKEPDPWVLGFAVVLRDNGFVVGTAGYKGPPGADGVVEIAYQVAPEHEGKGYATEAAAALTAYALRSGRARVVRAHTLPGPNASTRVLEKCGFHNLGEVIDPVDGLVWRWEMGGGAAQRAVVQ